MPPELAVSEELPEADGSGVLEEPELSGILVLAELLELDGSAVLAELGVLGPQLASSRQVVRDSKRRVFFIINTSQSWCARRAHKNRAV